MWATVPLDTAQSFYTSFSFDLLNPGGTMADGFAFVMQNNGTSALGNGGGYVGYAGLNGPAWILQTWVNNHLGFASTVGDPYSAPPAVLDFGNSSEILGTTTVAYDAQTKTLTSATSLVLTGGPNPGSYSFRDLQNFDLTTLGASLTVGFTGATGGAVSDQRITAWQLSSAATVPEPEELWLLLAGMCVLVGLGSARARPGKQKGTDSEVSPHILSA